MNDSAPHTHLQKKLRISVDKLYVGGEELLNEIEEGLNTSRI